MLGEMRPNSQPATSIAAAAHEFSPLCSQENLLILPARWLRCAAPPPFRGFSSRTDLRAPWNVSSGDVGTVVTLIRNSRATGICILVTRSPLAGCGTGSLVPIAYQNAH